MNDPKRLLEENNDEFENELLRSVRVDTMTDHNRQRVLAGIGLATAGLTASTATASTSATSAAVKTGLFKGVSATTVKWIAICSVVALVPTGVWVARSQREVSIAPAATVAAAPAAPVVAPPSAPLDTALPAEDTAPEAKLAPQAAQPVASTLADEVAALQVARTALAAHDPSGAIVALDRYKSRFASGKLGPEATVLRIDALNQRGDHAAASALGDRFLAAHPHSPYADRVRSILSSPKGAAKDAPSR